MTLVHFEAYFVMDSAEQENMSIYEILHALDLTGHIKKQPRPPGYIIVLYKIFNLKVLRTIRILYVHRLTLINYILK